MKNLNFSFPKLQKTAVLLLLLAVFSTGFSTQLVGAQGEQYNVTVTYAKDSLHEFIGQYEHTGVLIVDNAGQDDDAKTLKMDVNARVVFDQRFTGNEDKLQAIRHYRKSLAKIQIDDNKSDSVLKDDNKLIVARIQNKSSQRLQVASISDVLKQSELDLIRNPADPLAYVKVFDKQDVAVGDSWKADSDALADFLAVDSIYENEIQLKLKSVSGGIAKVYLIGTVKAEIDDVTTEMDVSGVALIDLNKKHLKALRTTIVEQKSAGQIAPGFEGETTIDVKMSPQQSVKELSNQALAQTTSKKIDRRIKWEGDQFEVTFDPRWRIIASENEAAVLRYVDNGLLLAQCNIVQLPSRKPSSPLQLNNFRSEVQKIVTGKKEKALIVQADELKTATDLTALRVLVEGQESDIDIQWIYYHVSSDDGRCLTYVFTLEKEVADRFATADKLFVNETKFRPRVARKSGTPRTSKR